MRKTNNSILPTPIVEEEIKIETVQDAVRFLCGVLREMRNGKISIKLGTAQAYICQIIVNALRHHEIEEVSQKLKILESVVLNANRK